MIEGGLIVAGILSIIIGFLSFSQQRRSPIVLFFFLTMLGSSAWAIGIALFLLADTREMLVASAIIYYIAAASIAVSALLIGYVLRFHRLPKDSAMMAIALPFVALSLTIAINPGALLASVTVADSNTATLVPVVYAVYVLYFLSYFLMALVFLFGSAQKAVRRQRTSYRYLFIAYLVGGGVGAWFNLILPIFGNYSLIWAGPLAVFPFILIVYVAIVRHGLFDIRLALSRMTAYVFSITTIAAVYVFLVMVVSKWILSSSDAHTNDIATVVSAIFLVFAFQPIKQFFDKVTNSLFYRNRYSRESFYTELSRVLTESTELRSLLRRAAAMIAKNLGASQVFFTVSDARRILNVGTKEHARLAHADYDCLIEWWSRPENERRVLVTRDGLIGVPESAVVERLLRSYGTDIALILRQANEVRGILLIGRRITGRYTARDYSVLETVSDELTIALQNALSLREVQLLNETLQQRIDEATKELRASNTQLRRLDEAKDEFISMASHQLRTPLTSIKGYIDMMLEGDAGDITPAQRKFLTEAFGSSERMVHLINDFLNVSRLQTGKFTVEKRPTDLSKLVEQELDGLKISANGRDLSFSYKGDKKIPKLMLDEGKLRQVIMNFADNALYYSRPGTTIKVALVLEDDDVVFTVKDTGIGVPEAEQSRLFTKFFRATNARKQRPDGTGVGLYLAKRVVTGHGGSIIFSSAENKGSTFGFRLPVNRLRVRDEAN